MGRFGSKLLGFASLELFMSPSFRPFWNPYNFCPKLSRNLTMKFSIFFPNFFNLRCEMGYSPEFIRKLISRFKNSIFQKWFSKVPKYNQWNRLNWTWFQHQKSDRLISKRSSRDNESRDTVSPLITPFSDQ